MGGDKNGPDCENPGTPPCCVACCHPTCASYVEPLYCGYAGGLGPANITQQLPLIAKAASEAKIWIDMERNVRNEDDSVFDFLKVNLVAELVSPFVSME